MKVWLGVMSNNINDEYTQMTIFQERLLYGNFNITHSLWYLLPIIQSSGHGHSTIL